MTAEQAISSIREDIAALDRKNLVKPGHIRRRTAEVDAIVHALADYEAHQFRLEARIADIEREGERDRLILGMLANMLTILGFPWQSRARYLNADEAAIMSRAAAIAAEQNINISDANTPKWRLRETLQLALIAARMERRLNAIPTPFTAHAQATEEEAKHQ
ncbi:MAG TPA: hypothetical protein PL010_12115 [Flavobacteriales bacterium]|nr:hypothetical protein [Flavobacteriales bacterium]HNA32559.1 hypothetical protein [Flavobacteriales bacterium]HNI05361.1 hypothetical protein [Flavobacteriales bacterium]HNK41882.1 hypothetical protein [Flavobacteriales bacterium]HNM69109.1 hypothetical protein [Flavobacteriales bacterium]